MRRTERERVVIGCDWTGFGFRHGDGRLVMTGESPAKINLRERRIERTKCPAKSRDYIGANSLWQGNGEEGAKI